MNDEEAVAEAAREYFAGWYEADVARIDAVLHPRLVKRSPEQVSGQGPAVTTRDRMLELTLAGGGTADRTDDPVEVVVVDVHHDVAAAVVRSAQYREYLHLLRTPDGWRIVDAFWRLTESDAAPDAGAAP